jgi:hypothetical protein
MRHRRDAHASSTPCLTRPIACLDFNIISSTRHTTNATHRAPTRRRRIAVVSPTRRRCVTDATPTHRQRLALHAPLLGLSSTSFPHLVIQPT